MSQETIIRQAINSDASALSRLLTELGYPTEILMVSERLKQLDRTNDALLVALDAGTQVVGMILLHRTPFLHRPPDGRIVTLVVAEACRNQGIGALLVEAAESIFRDWGCGRVEVSSGAAREAAHRFYIRAGYSEKPKRFIKLL